MDKRVPFDTTLVPAVCKTDTRLPQCWTKDGFGIGSGENIGELGGIEAYRTFVPS